MLAAQHPITGDQKFRPKSGRKPLQPKNFPANPVVDFAKAKPKKKCVESISLIDESNKENSRISAAPSPASLAAAKIESFDSSLAEELSAIKKRLERLRIDRERTEKTLKEKDAALDLQMKELENRGEIQKKLEIEVDRLYRLNQLHSQTMRISPIRSLREKELEKKATTEFESQELKSQDRDESVGESVSQELIMSSASPGLVAENEQYF